VIYYLTFWYRDEEQALRIALFYVSALLAGAFSGVLAFIILRMDGVGGLSGWQWLFLIEGLPSAVFGAVTWFYLPNFPWDSKWLTEEEREMATERVMTISNIPDSSSPEQSVPTNSVEEPSVQTHVHEASPYISWKDMKETLLDAQLWIFCAIDFAVVTPAYSISFFLPSVIQEMGFGVLTSNLMTVPIYLVTGVVTVGVSYSSDRFNERFFHIMVPLALSTCGFVALAVLDIIAAHTSFTETTALSYISVMLAAMGLYPSIPLLLAWLTDTFKKNKAAVSSAIVISAANVGGIVGPQIFGGSEQAADTYSYAFWAMGGFLVLGMAFTVLLYWWSSTSELPKPSSSKIVEDSPLLT